MAGLTDLLKTEHEAAGKCHICFKTFSSENKKIRDYCLLSHGFIIRSIPQQSQPEISDTIAHPLVLYNLRSYDTHLFIKELGNKFNRYDVGINAEYKEKYISFKVKINVKLAKVINKDSKEVCMNI